MPPTSLWERTLRKQYMPSLQSLDCEYWVAFQSYLQTGPPEQFSMESLFKIIPDHWYNQPCPKIENYLGARYRPPSGTTCSLLGHFGFYSNLEYERDAGNYFKFIVPGYTLIHTDQVYTSYTPMCQHFAHKMNISMGLTNWLTYCQFTDTFPEEIPFSTVDQLMTKIFDLASGVQRKKRSLSNRL